MAVAAFHHDVVTGNPPDAVIRDFAARYTTILGEAGILPTSNSPYALGYTRTYTPGWAIACAIFLFPIGLIALLAKKQDQMSVTASPYGQGSRVVISGSG